MSAYDDDDDWVGEPPEGRHTADRANPGFWRQGFPVATVATATIGILIVVVLLIALL